MKAPLSDVPWIGLSQQPPGITENTFVFRPLGKLTLIDGGEGGGAGVTLIDGGCNLIDREGVCTLIDSVVHFDKRGGYAL